MTISRSALALVVVVAMTASAQQPKGVAVVANEAQHRVDVTIDGTAFTSYLWATNQRKPVLYPLVSPDGTTVTRGYPFAMRAGERVDHPHHAGLWFNYGNVNGFDFWNNSDAIRPEDRAKFGTISQDGVVSTKSGKDSGELVVGATWTTGAGEEILAQTTRYVFLRVRAGEHEGRGIDLTVSLKALSPVVFHDDKEGMLGLRVARFLESATATGGVYQDANGNQTKVSSDTTGATGMYRMSAGKTGDAVWGTRGRWCVLSGSVEGKTESIAIFDHAGNPGYPAYWHARGYGLFAVNPLGAHVFDPKAPAMNFSIAKGETATFRYRVVILSSAVSDAEMNRMADEFDAQAR